MSNTPLSDAVACDGWSGDACCVSYEAAQEIERLIPKWQPIETAPKDVEALFYVVSLTIDDPHFVDTSGNPILSSGKPRLMLTQYGRWSSLQKATHWMPLPEPPQ